MAVIIAPLISVADSGGAEGARAPLLGKPKNIIGPHKGKNHGTTPPPPLNRVCFLRPRKNSATTPPPTESRRLGTSHEMGPLFRKILDLRLDLLRGLTFARVRRRWQLLTFRRRARCCRGVHFGAFATGDSLRVRPRIQCRSFRS